MNRFPLWKNVLIFSVVIVSLIYALPNIYSPDPAVQISPASTRIALDQSVLDKAKAKLDELKIPYFGAQLSDKNVLIRLQSQDDQMRARREIEGVLGEDYIVAVNLASTTPKWLQNIGAKPMSLGLDLAGGVHFLLEVDTQRVMKDNLEDSERYLRKAMRDNKWHGLSTKASAGQLNISANSDELRQQVLDFMHKDMREFDITSSEESGRYLLVAKFSEKYIHDKEDQAVDQNLVTLRKRVNEIGVAEPLVQRQGRNRIVVQLPGIQDSSLAKKILGKTANLEFRLEAKPDASVIEKEHFDFLKPEEQRRFGGADLERNVLVYGKSVLSAQPSFDQQTNSPEVLIQLDAKGATDMNRGTRNNIGRKMGTLFIEYKPVKRTVIGPDGKKEVKIDQVPEKKIISLATVRAALGKSFVITGLDSPEEASELALYLRAGALAAPMTYVEERTIGPSLGAENIHMGVQSVELGLALVFIFMLLYYRVFGLAANLAMIANLFMLVACMSILGATLTLPGIAGIVLTMGMAVDANVLIYSRIREEIKNGSPNQTAIMQGFDRAFATILDSNLTTLIVALILWLIGTGPVQGFAVTLSIGIGTSMFTAVLVARALINFVYGGRNVNKLWI